MGATFNETWRMTLKSWDVLDRCSWPYVHPTHGRARKDKGITRRARRRDKRECFMELWEAGYFDQSAV